MRIEIKNTVKVDELADLIPRKAGATWSSLWRIFYYTRLFKYVHKRHYPKIKRSFDKICTHDKLQRLCRLGYFRNPQDNVYCATDKVLPILREAGFRTEFLPSQPKGKGDINELNNTDIFIQLIKKEHFHSLLYPNFGYIIPDAMLLQMDSNKQEYKLTFIEVERQKPDWENYLEIKREKYLRLAKDITVYTYWQKCCEKLNFTEPKIEDFCFTVSFYGPIKKDFGTYFNFYNG